MVGNSAVTNAYIRAPREQARGRMKSIARAIALEKKFDAELFRFTINEPKLRNVWANIRPLTNISINLKSNGRGSYFIVNGKQKWHKKANGRKK